MTAVLQRNPYLVLGGAFGLGCLAHSAVAALHKWYYTAAATGGGVSFVKVVLGYKGDQTTLKEVKEKLQKLHTKETAEEENDKQYFIKVIN